MKRYLGAIVGVLFLSALAIGAAAADRFSNNVIIGNGVAGTKTLTFDIGGSNPLVESIGGVLKLSTNGTNLMTVPAATDTFVGKATNDTLTNKDLTASSNTFTDADPGVTQGTVSNTTQTFAGAKTFTSLVTGNSFKPTAGTSANFTIWQGTNTLALRGGTSGIVVRSTADADIFSISDAGGSTTNSMTFAGTGSGSANYTLWQGSNTLNMRGGTSGFVLRSTADADIATVSNAGAVTAASYKPTAGTSANFTVWQGTNTLSLRGGTSGVNVRSTSDADILTLSDGGNLAATGSVTATALAVTAASSSNFTVSQGTNTLNLHGGTSGFTFRSTTNTDLVTVNNSAGVSIAGSGGNGGNVVHQCTRTTSTSGAGATSKSISCAAGQILTGGGCSSTGGSTVESYPSSATTWQCTMTSTTITAYALCCQY